METLTVSISENDAIVELGTFVNYKFPSVKTKVEYKLTDISEMNESVVPCTDIVSFDGLEIGHTYRIKGEIRRKKDASLLETKYIELSGYTEFVANEKQMDVEVLYKIKYCEELAGIPIVFFEYVEDTAYPGETIAVHTDINDEMQTICFPKHEEPTTEEVTTETPTTTEAVTTEMPTTTEAVTTEVPTTTETIVTVETIPTTEVKGTSETLTTEITTEKAQTEESVKTGDEANLFLVIMILSTTFVGIILLVMGKKHNRR